LKSLTIGDQLRDRKRKRTRNRVECLENIALAVDDSAAKGGIKIVLLNDAPGDELLRLAITVLPKSRCVKPYSTSLVLVSVHRNRSPIISF